ncbi:MAG TPA: PilZ domain-containing protein [Stellaceae bacterium]|nr:PilZ domain-containing protein [Stellaceae bacterium]
MRRDRRYAVPAVAVTLGGTQYRARNWSLGGLLLEAGPAVAIGGQVTGELRVADRGEGFPITAEAVRCDKREGLLACRFVEPSSAMVGALDSAVAARFLRRPNAARAGLGVALLAALLLAALPARAGSSGMLVPGGAPLPEFRLDFPNLLLDPIGPPATHDLQISVDSPDRGVFSFLFSPRSRFGLAQDPTTGTSRSYAGLTWNLFDHAGFFGNLSIAGSVTRPGPEEMYRRYLGPTVGLHQEFELGYQLGDRHSLTLSLDHETSPDPFAERSELDNLRLRYGLKF